MEPAAIEQLLVALAGRALVVVDEAYIEFSGDASLDERIWRGIRTSSCCAPCPRHSVWPARASAR